MPAEQTEPWSCRSRGPRAALVLVPRLASLHHSTELVLPKLGAAQRTHEHKLHQQSGHGPKYIHQTLFPSPTNSEGTHTRAARTHIPTALAFRSFSCYLGHSMRISPQRSIRGLHGTVFSSIRSQGPAQAGSAPRAPTHSPCRS